MVATSVIASGPKKSSVVKSPTNESRIVPPGSATKRGGSSSTHRPTIPVTARNSTKPTSCCEDQGLKPRTERLTPTATTTPAHTTLFLALKCISASQASAEPYSSKRASACPYAGCGGDERGTNGRSNSDGVLFRRMTVENTS